MAFFTGLSPAHLRGLKDHKYKSEGTNISEVFLQPFWRWTVEQVPLWMAPNLLSFIGLLVNVITSLAVIFTDLNAKGQSPPILYLLAGVGLFIYQTLDGIDGKQARRTGTNNQLGELFDHGCDAISTILIAMAGASAVGLNRSPYLLLFFVLSVEFVNYIYHWQTFVCGILQFRKVDCSEAQICYMALMGVAYFLGTDIWDKNFPVLGVQMRLLLGISIIFISIFNFVSSFAVILTGGVGKNGATVADTSVLSPILPVGVIFGLFLYYAGYSSILSHHCMLLMAAMISPIVKFILHIIIAGMCKTPLPLFDPIMIGPAVAVVNLKLGALVPEIYLLMALVVFNVYDIICFCIIVVRQVSNYLEVSCFSIPYSPPTSSGSGGGATTSS